MPRRRTGAKGIFESVVEVDNVKFRHIQIRHKEKRAKRLLKSVSKKIKNDFISKDTHIKEKYKKEYIHILNFNAFTYIIKQYRLKNVTVYDPGGLMAHRLQEIMRYVNFLRVVTDNIDIYSLYNEECFETMGCSAAVCEKLPNSPQQILFCTALLPKKYDCKGAFIIGEGGYNSVISAHLSPQTATKCPDGIAIDDFFTALAVLCSCHTLLNGIPLFIQLDNKAKNINALHF